MITAHLIETIQTSMDAFDSCDWTHEYRSLDGDIGPDYCEGGDDGCAYCAAVRVAAVEAQALAEEAIAFVCRGDVATAACLLEQAARIERGFGDAVAYRPALQAILALADAE